MFESWMLKTLLFFRTKVTELNLIFSVGYLLTCSKCGAYLSKYGILTSWGKEFVLTNRFWICKNYWTYLWVGKHLVEGSNVCCLWKICFLTRLKKGIPLCLKHWFQSHVFHLNQAINKISLLCYNYCVVFIDASLYKVKLIDAFKSNSI